MARTVQQVLETHIGQMVCQLSHATAVVEGLQDQVATLTAETERLRTERDDARLALEALRATLDGNGPGGFVADTARSTHGEG